MKHIHTKAPAYELGVHVVRCICFKQVGGVLDCPYKHVIFQVIDVEEMHSSDIYVLRSIGKYSYDSKGIYYLDSDGAPLQTSIGEEFLETL